MSTIITLGAVHRIAQKIGERLFAAMKSGKLSAINIDTIRAAIEVASIYEGLTPDEMRALEDRLLRDVIARVG